MNNPPETFTDRITGIAALNDPVRRNLYLYVSESRADVSRDEAAAACGISRSLAAFHLDKLVDEGLLEPTYKRLTGRTGPGAGRPTKLYRRSGREVSVSLPPRSYELAARLFASALDGAGALPAQAELGEVAHRFGETVGAETQRDTESGPDHPQQALMQALRAYGYEPYEDTAGDVRLHNCPFHLLARDHRELVCGMNLQLMAGVVEGLGLRDVTAVLEPRPHECCVAFRIGEPDSRTHPLLPG
jgi:predicted ArsR family transcriptional regulator